MAGDDPLWDDICETLLSLAKARPKPQPQRRVTRSTGAHWQRLREEAKRRPPGKGTEAARALAAFEPGAWLGSRDIAQRANMTARMAPIVLYGPLWRKGWIEQIDDPDRPGRPIPGKGPRGPYKLWRLTALGEAVRAALLSGATQVAEYEDRPTVGLAENPWRPKPAKRKPRRSGARSRGGRGRSARLLSTGSGRAG